MSQRLASLFVIALLAAAVPAYAQFNTGTITGVVRDQTGGVLPGANVEIVNAGTGEQRTVVTNGEGRYEALALPTGVYAVHATLTGFQRGGVTNLQLAVGERARVDIELRVDVGEHIEVSAPVTRTNTESSEIGDTISQARVANLPINGRDFTQLLATVPGSVQSSNFFQTSLNGVPTWFGQGILVDGIDAGRGDLNGVSNVLGRIDARINRASVDSIQEVQVLEQTYSAQYGQAIGTIVNAISKSGTNTLSGGLFEYFRNDALDANDFFANARNVGKPDFKLNQFGGNLGGPIIRDRAFFFGNYEGVRQNQQNVLQGLVPTPSFRSTFVPAMAPVLAALPLPNSSAATSDPRVGLYSTLGTRELREDTGAIKVDVNMSAVDRLTVRYNINDSKTITQYGIASGQTAPGTLRVQLLKLTHTRTIGTNAVNEAAVGLNRNVTYPREGDTTLPVFNFAFIDGALAQPGQALFSQYRATNDWQFVDTFSLVHDNHAWKLGTDIRVNRRDARVDQQDQFVFFSLADFANDAPFQVQRIGQPLLHYANENYSFFAQDDWKALSRLTLNLGVRYDVSSVSRERNGLLQNYDLTTRTYTPVGAAITNPDLNNVAPRVGFAWDVRGTQKTVVRGGWGYFYNQELPASFGSPQNDTFPNLTVNVFDALFAGVPLAFPLQDNLFALAPPSSKAINVIDPNLRTPYAQQWSLNVQQDIGLGVVQVGYVGNRVRKMTAGSSITALNLNRTDPFTGQRPIADLGDVFWIAGYPKSNYDALQASFKRGLSHGLGINVNYTYAVEKDDAIGFLEDYQDTNNPEGDWSYGDHDLRHNFTFDVIYNVPTSALKFLPDRLAEGWQISSITQMRSGMPVNVTVTGGLFGGSLRPNRVAGVSTSPSDYREPDHQYNADAFVAPPAGTYGALPRNALRGPMFAQVDFSLSKATRLAGSAQLQFRADVFNLFNHTNFSVPFSGLNRDPLTNSLNPTVSFGQSYQTVGTETGSAVGPGGPRQMQLSVRLSF